MEVHSKFLQLLSSTAHQEKIPRKYIDIDATVRIRHLRKNHLERIANHFSKKHPHGVIVGSVDPAIYSYSDQPQAPVVLCPFCNPFKMIKDAETTAIVFGFLGPRADPGIFSHRVYESSTGSYQRHLAHHHGVNDSGYVKQPFVGYSLTNLSNLEPKGSYHLNCICPYANDKTGHPCLGEFEFDLNEIDGNPYRQYLEHVSQTHCHPSITSDNRDYVSYDYQITDDVGESFPNVFYPLSVEKFNESLESLRACCKGSIADSPFVIGPNHLIDLVTQIRLEPLEKYIQVNTKERCEGIPKEEHISRVVPTSPAQRKRSCAISRISGSKISRSGGVDISKVLENHEYENEELDTDILTTEPDKESRFINETTDADNEYSSPEYFSSEEDGYTQEFDQASDYEAYMSASGDDELNNYDPTSGYYHNASDAIEQESCESDMVESSEESSLHDEASDEYESDSLLDEHVQNEFHSAVYFQSDTEPLSESSGIELSGNDTYLFSTAHEEHLFESEELESYEDFEHDELESYEEFEHDEYYESLVAREELVSEDFEEAGASREVTPSEESELPHQLIQRNAVYEEYASQFEDQEEEYSVYGDQRHDFAYYYEEDGTLVYIVDFEGLNDTYEAPVVFEIEVSDSEADE